MQREQKAKDKRFGTCVLTEFNKNVDLTSGRGSGSGRAGGAPATTAGGSRCLGCHLDIILENRLGPDVKLLQTV